MDTSERGAGVEECLDLSTAIPWNEQPNRSELPAPSATLTWKGLESPSASSTSMVWSQWIESNISPTTMVIWRPLAQRSTKKSK